MRDARNRLPLSRSCCSRRKTRTLTVGTAAARDGPLSAIQGAHQFKTGAAVFVSEALAVCLLPPDFFPFPPAPPLTLIGSNGAALAERPDPVAAFSVSFGAAGAFAVSFEACAEGLGSWASFEGAGVATWVAAGASAAVALAEGGAASAGFGAAGCASEGFWNSSRCMGEKMPNSPPCSQPPCR